MLFKKHLPDRIIFAGGPPRSGTKTAVKSLNEHPKIVAAIDDHVYECWALYYYRTREGIVQILRTQQCDSKRVKGILTHHLIAGNSLAGIAPSSKTANLLFSPPPIRPDSSATQQDIQMIRHSLPLRQFRKDWYLCLKSPEISFVLPQLAEIFPRAKFVLVYRPIIEIAESMYRKGHAVKNIPVYHARWRQETDEFGEMVPPPGVQEKWAAQWNSVSDFTRCLIYSASYLKAVVTNLSNIHPERYFLYNHIRLRQNPGIVFEKMAHFLGLEMQGFRAATKDIISNAPAISAGIRKEYDAFKSELNLEKLLEQVESLSSLK